MTVDVIMCSISGQLKEWMIYENEYFIIRVYSQRCEKKPAH